MSVIGIVELIAKIDTSQYKSGAKEIDKANESIQNSAKDAEKGTDSSFTKIGNTATNMGKVIAAGIGIGTVAIAGMATKMLLAGGELEQQLGGAEAVFGEFSQDIVKTSQKAYEDMGLSQAEFLQGANKMGSLYQGAGVEVQKSMEMSTEAIQRATDVASIMGIDTSFALESVTAMAKGNFTMMDNLGVAMSETALNAYALEKGLGETTQQMTQAEKVGLATQLFLEKTAKFAGNYAKENDSLSGSLNTTKKAFENFMSGSGFIEDFIDSLLHTVELAIPQLEKLLPKLVDGIGQILVSVFPVLMGLVQKVVPIVVNALFELFRTVLKFLPQWVQGLASLLPQFIQGFVELFVGVIKALPQIVRALTTAIPIIVSSLTTALTAPGMLQEVLFAAVDLFMAIVEALPIIIVALTDAMPLIIEAVVGVLTSPAMIEKMTIAGVQLFMGLVKAIPLILGAMLNAYAKLFGDLWNKLSPAFVDFAGNFGNAMGNAFKNAFNGVLKFINGFINDPINAINSAIDAINKIPGVKIGKLSKVSIPMLAEGGIVSKSTLAMIGEGREPEAVVPLSKLDDMISNGGQSSNNRTNHYNITIQGAFATSSSDQRRIAQQILDTIKDIEQSKGLSGRLA